MIVAAVFVVAWGVRLALLWLTRPDFTGLYWDLSDNILQSGALGLEGHARTDYDALYPLFLSAMRSIVPGTLFAQVVQAGIGAAGAVSANGVAHTLTGDRRAATCAGALYALYPALVWHAIDPSDVALTSTLLVTFAWASARASTPSRAMRAGVCLGALVLARIATFPLVVLVPALHVWRSRVRNAAVLAFGAALVILPYSIRNYGLNGSLLPTRSGWNVVIGNSPYDVIPEYGPDVLHPYVENILRVAGLPSVPASPAQEREIDRVLTRRALEDMRRQPVRTVAMIAKKAWYVFVPRLVPYYRLGPDTTIALFDDGRFTVANASPRPLSHQWVYSASYVFVIVAAALGIYVRRTRLLQSDAVLWLIVLSFVAVYAVYFPSTGYLTPIAFVWLFYASVGLTQSRRPRGSPLGPAAARRSGADT